MNRAAVVQKGRDIIYRISPDLKVLNGPFRDLQYPHVNLQRSSLPARIIGSYEKHLHPFIQRIINTDYTDLLEIGSAEGYYAVGLAQKMQSAIIHCYDTDSASMEFCYLMAQNNKVDNLTYNQFCSKETLRNFAADTNRGFIFCDCEGYEIELFTTEIAKTLDHFDLLIELHEVFHPGLTNEIIHRFKQTHWIEKINNSQQDFSNLRGLELLTEEDKEFALCEHRGGFGLDIVMEWLFLTAKQGTAFKNYGDSLSLK